MFKIIKLNCCIPITKEKKIFLGVSKKLITIQKQLKKLNRSFLCNV